MLEIPVDFGKKIKGYPIFGAHKTWRGLICGTVAGIIVVWLQVWLYQFPFVQEISILDYTAINFRGEGIKGRWMASTFFGLLISFGAVFGDLLFAFFKRRQEIPPGKPWIPFDQINYVVGAFLFLNPFLEIEISYWLGILVLTFLLHLTFNYVGYRLGLSRAKL